MPTAHQIDRTKVIIYEHRDRLIKYLTRFICNLSERVAVHDDSKLDVEELEPYSSVIEEFGKHKFGSEGYEEIRKRLGPALDHHFKHNRHHPEHFETGINEMNLVDLIEMLCDWKAATKNTGGNGDLLASIQILSDKYKISPQLAQIMINTAKDFGLV